MADEITQKIQKATRLINDEDFDAAIVLLEEVLRADRENVKAWWLMANAVDAPDEAREALEIVLELDPDHKNAQAMLDQLDQMHPAEAPSEAESFPTEVVTEAQTEPDWLALDDTSSAASPPAAPFETTPSAFDSPDQIDAETLDDEFSDFDFIDDDDDDFFGDDDDDGFDDKDADFDDDDDFELYEDEKKPDGRSRRRLLLFLLALLGLVLIVAAVVAARTLGGGSKEDAGEQAAEPTPVSADAETDATIETLRAQYATTLVTISDTLTSMGRSETAADFRATAQGPALMGRFCWAEPRGWDMAALDAMGVVTAQAKAMGDDRPANVGVELTFCGSETVLLTRVTSLDQAIDFYINKDSAQADFLNTWVEP